MTKALVIRDLKKVYAGGVEALKGINLDVKQGDFFGLLGPNGAGKSTTLSIITSLVNKTSGTVAVFGYDIDTHFSQTKKHLGVVPQEFNFSQFEKVFDIVVTQGGYYGIPLKLARQRAEHYLKKIGLWDKRNTQARMLSGGMKRRLMIARALIHEPKVLILDEPTAGVDVELRKDMWALVHQLRQEGTTIILTTHYIEEAELMADRIGVISQGEIILVEEKNELMAKMGKKQLQLHLSEPLTELPSAFSEFDLALEENGTNLVYTYDARGSRTGITRLLQQLSEHNIKFKDLNTKQSSLEEIFVELVKQPS